MDPIYNSCCSAKRFGSALAVTSITNTLLEYILLPISGGLMGWPPLFVITSQIHLLEFLQPDHCEKYHKSSLIMHR